MDFCRLCCIEVIPTRGRKKQIMSENKFEPTFDQMTGSLKTAGHATHD